MADITRLGPADFADLEILEQACFPDEAWSESLLRLQLSDTRRSVFGFTAAGLQGFACFLQVLDEAELLQVGVLPQWRGKGIARQLLRHCLLCLQQQGIRRVLLEVRDTNLPAQQLYRALGFELEGRREAYYPACGKRPAEAALMMSLRLDDPPQSSEPDQSEW